MKRQLSSASSGASSLNGNDGLGSADEQVQPPSTSASEQSTESSELEGGLLLDSHLAQLLGMRPGERLCRGVFYGSPMASYVSSLAAQFLDKQEGLLRRGLGEGTSSITQHSMAEYLSMSRYNALAIRALLDSVEAPASVITGEGVSTMHGQSPSASHWQDPSAPHWQDPSASHWQDPSASHWQDPSASHWQDPSAPHWQDPSASHWQDPSASHWQDPSASHWQD
ncbi:hypothetical protein, partial [Candidatus Ichthyocystis sparus]|uniref:hypothetical protein n=1 Tax=Candidatus Ichthyocystis sparus TaxID=1561004 RepID=UPI001F5EFC3D